ncbi:hypothetical protein KEM56_002208, partial [Ascosphaera pollenicola]
MWVRLLSEDTLPSSSILHCQSRILRECSADVVQDIVGALRIFERDSSPHEENLLELENNSLLKIVQLDDNSNTATLFFRTIRSAHAVAKLWIHDTIQNWRSRNNYDDIKTVGASTEYAVGSQRNPDGAWGPAIVRSPRRLLIVEVGFSQSVEDMEDKLRFWFDAGASYALLLNIVKETREVSLNLCQSDGLTSHIKVWENNGRIHKEGTSIVLSPAVIADRASREDDVNLRFTAETLASSLPLILREIDYS